MERITSVHLTFNGQDQMKEFVVAAMAAPNPKQNIINHYSGGQDSNSNSSVWPFAMGVLIGAAID